MIRRLLSLFPFCLMFEACLCQEVEFHMGSSYKTDSIGTINDLSLLKNDSVREFYSFSGVNIKDHLKYGRYGIDISKWDGRIDWKKVAQDTVPDKIYFVISKATQGISMVDKTFQDNFRDTKRNGYIAGAYHFYSQKQDPILQADNFIRTVRLGNGDLLPVIDIERNCLANCDSVPDLLVPRDQLIKDIKVFIGRIKDHYKTEIIIYTGEAFYNDYLSEDFKDEYFWIAKYNKTPPKCFQLGELFFVGNPCFKNSKKGCWQYSAFGRVKGIESNVDLNFINNYYLLKWVIK